MSYKNIYVLREIVDKSAQTFCVIELLSRNIHVPYRIIFIKIIGGSKINSHAGGLYLWKSRKIGFFIIFISKSSTYFSLSSVKRP